ncbi:CDP-alcohol phosphatidyltransferase family protein [Asticcacaulis sp. BYS171W]|uniref:CDP-alcohol phosphatidyltransferase family protein n=1 Tax=Asticcacaulis aquaticus TaxID=2984212 RepID=A0ABT5HRY6_9CAUL|nr:CDP-alcohol phosphatidyltransferase family protein [Asticcacaulis aquaticus]MDC7682832.1 CDP-alcohol phosphatidyltransferase family protein [Asticcacaulis aquaticus]
MIARQIPWWLIGFRLLAGPVMIALCLLNVPHASILCVGLLAVGVVSDIFDGVIARKLDCVTPALRVMDSRADVVFWLSVAVAVHLLHPALIGTTWVMIAVLGAMELSVHLISYVRFKREASTHHILSKLFTLGLWALLSQMFVTGQAGVFFWLILALGVVSQLEAALIMLTVPTWVCDVKSLKQARKLAHNDSV